MPEKPNDSVHAGGMTVLEDQTPPSALAEFQEVMDVFTGLASDEDHRRVWRRLKTLAPCIEAGLAGGTSVPWVSDNEADGPSSLARIQAEVAEWQEKNFGEHPAYQPILGALEELGELAHAFLKREQGIRGTPEEHAAAIEDAVADTIIFLLDFGNAEGIDVGAAVESTWERVRQRDWSANRITGTSPSDGATSSSAA